MVPMNNKQTFFQLRRSSGDDMTENVRIVTPSCPLLSSTDRCKIDNDRTSLHQIFVPSHMPHVNNFEFLRLICCFLNMGSDVITVILQAEINWEVAM